MTQTANVPTWVKPTAGLGLVVGLILAWAYLAGGLFLLAHDKDFESATPLTLYRYWYFYGQVDSVRQWLIAAAAGALVMVATPFALLLTPTRRSLFGDARFASASMVRRAGLLGERGIVVGRFKGKFLMFDGAQHVLMSAPTRSGKGVGVVIPNLLTWPDSVVVLDIKQENFSITSAFRQRHGQPCYLFNPAATDYRSHRYNPLTYISQDPNFRIDDVQKVANMLFPDQPGTDVIWTATPRTLFLGIVLFLLESPGKSVTLGQVLRESLADGDGAKYFSGVIALRALGERVRTCAPGDAQRQARQDFAAVFADRSKSPEHHVRTPEMAVWFHLSSAYRDTVGELLAQRVAGDERTPDLVAMLNAVPFDRGAAEVGLSLSGPCVRALNAYVSIASENTRAGVMTSFRSRLELWNNPLVDAATSENDFDLRDIRKRRMSIYLGVTPDNLERMAPLLNLFFQQLIDLNTRELPEFNPELKYQCLLLADEFTAMGKVGVLSKGISYVAGYGLRLLPIIQSPAQLVEVYGKDAAQTFTTNHALQVVFPPKASEVATARDISEWLGYQTVKGVSESKGAGVFTKRERSHNVSDQRRALLLPQEITGLGRERQLVVVEDCAPILAEKIRYYSDPVFMDRLKTVSRRLALCGSRLPSVDELKAAIKAGELATAVPGLALRSSSHSRTDAEATVAAFLEAPQTPGASVSREVTAHDIPGLNSLPLSAFVIDFGDIVAPPPGAVDVEALCAYTDSMCAKFCVAAA